MYTVKLLWLNAAVSNCGGCDDQYRLTCAMAVKWLCVCCLMQEYIHTHIQIYLAPKIVKTNLRRWPQWRLTLYKKIIMLFYGKLNSQSVIVCVQPTYYEYSLTKLFMFLFVCYILIETGTGLYKYSYYANNIFVRRIIHISFVWQCLDIIVIQNVLVWLFYFWSCFMSGQQTFSIYESGFLQAGCPFLPSNSFLLTSRWHQSTKSNVCTRWT